MEQLPLLHLQPSLFFLFILSFLAATFIPVGSEWLLTMMILGGFSPTQTVITATLGNYIGGCTTYLIGFYGAELLINT